MRSDVCMCAAPYDVGLIHVHSRAANHPHGTHPHELVLLCG